MVHLVQICTKVKAYTIYLGTFRYSKKVFFYRSKVNVIYCMSGVRARKAAAIFENFGYQNFRVYAGSFEDWLDKGGEIVFDD